MSDPVDGGNDEHEEGSEYDKQLNFAVLCEQQPKRVRTSEPDSNIGDGKLAESTVEPAAWSNVGE